jgi:dynein heavy chain
MKQVVSGGTNHLANAATNPICTNQQQVKRVRGDYMKDAAFTLENIKNISTAGAGLLKWVFAMVNYYGVAKGVEPKRKKVRIAAWCSASCVHQTHASNVTNAITHPPTHQPTNQPQKVAEAERSLRAAQKDLVDTKERLAELNRTLAGLRDQFAAKTAEQLDLKAKAEVGGGGRGATDEGAVLLCTCCESSSHHV